MSDMTSVFQNGAKVVISPDKMRAWVTLPAPPKGNSYTAEAITAWLQQNGVVYGADPGMLAKVVASQSGEMMEVARGKAPVAATGGDYTLLVDKKPFTGLRGSGDGSLFYDDLSFLQQAEAGQVLAEVIPPTAAEEGMTVTGEALQPREGTPGRVLEGSGFSVSADGRQYLAPTLSHVSVVNEKLVVTPLLRLAKLDATDGPVEFDGNVFVEGDVSSGAQITATGSIFVVGRAISARLKAGNNLLLSNGLRADGGFGHAEAGENVWGLVFESAEITAGKDLCSNLLSGCEATAGGRALIVGGRAAIIRTTLTATGGVIAGTLGEGPDDRTAITCGMPQSVIDNFNAVNQKSQRLAQDIQVLQQSIQAIERINRARPDKGRNDPKYKEMVTKRDQSLSVLSILENERTRMKRTIEQFSTVNVIVREAVQPGVTISIDTRSMQITTPMKRVRFRRAGEVIEASALG